MLLSASMQCFLQALFQSWSGQTRSFSVADSTCAEAVPEAFWHLSLFGVSEVHQSHGQEAPKENYK